MMMIIIIIIIKNRSYLTLLLTMGLHLHDSLYIASSK
jgi:hypothetical protein